jgi:hypothetical protein
VAYHLPPGQFSWMPPAGGGHAQQRFVGHFVSLGPAERHAQWRQGDQVFDQAVVSSFSTGVHDAAEAKIFRWNAVGESVKPPSGSGVNVEIDMHYLRVRLLLYMRNVILFCLYVLLLMALVSMLFFCCVLFADFLFAETLFSWAVSFPCDCACDHPGHSLRRAAAVRRGP